jgi:diaminohydroxyphosphoribosylaminopyrimidine deaminase/5-amino-6-(5-phosphoribosylamino)uracil reductase
VAVEVGLLEAEARAQNEVFFHALRRRRPFVLWKAALSLDGQVAARSGHAAWVSNALSRRVA